MTYATHKSFAVGWMLLANVALYEMGATEINYYLSMIIMLEFGKAGALFPDVDHHWNNVKEKNVPNFIVNKLIHCTGGRHRSWQTHSLDIGIVASILAFLVPYHLYCDGYIDVISKEVLSIVMVGFCMGWISHLVSDMLTYVGIRLLCFRNKRFALVPKQLFGIKFKTGEEWEKTVYKISRYCNIIIGIFVILYPKIRVYW